MVEKTFIPDLKDLELLPTHCDTNIDYNDNKESVYSRNVNWDPGLVRFLPESCSVLLNAAEINPSLANWEALICIKGIINMYEISNINNIELKTIVIIH